MNALRPYQQAAIESIWAFFRSDKNGACVALPTGSGKTPVLVNLAKQAVEEWGGRVLILAHVRELLSQARDKFLNWWPEAPIGVYSAGLKSRDTQDRIIIAGIQSVHRRARELGKFDLVIIDECHLLSVNNEDSMYRAFLADLTAINPEVRICGLTATPYRLDCGYICGPENILTEVCYESNVRDLIDQGYLCKLRGKQGHEGDISSVHLRGGDYITGELEDALADEETVKLAIDDCERHLMGRKAWIVFCVGVKHANMVHRELAKRGIIGGIVTGDMPTGERDEAIINFKAGEYRYLVNINVLAIGFDAPHIDAIVMLRPTQSPGLYYQQVGRGLRLHPSKTDCLVLDLAGNIRTHGGIDKIKVRGKKEKPAPLRTCPRCDEIVEVSDKVCTSCGYEFPPPPVSTRTVANHSTVADTVSPLSDGASAFEIRTITDIDFQIWTKKGAAPDAPKTLRVSYFWDMVHCASEWICFEHEGYANNKARTWWLKRCPKVPFPTSCKQALDLLLHIDIKVIEPKRVKIKLGGRYPELVDVIFSTPCDSCVMFEKGFCHQFGEDVPDDAQIDGCANHKPVVDSQEQSTLTTYGQSVPTGADCPF